MLYSAETLCHWKLGQLEKELVEANKRIDRLQREVDAFWTGKIIDGATLNEVVMARVGRKRLKEMKGCIWMKSDAEVKQYHLRGNL